MENANHFLALNVKTENSTPWHDIAEEQPKLMWYNNELSKRYCHLESFVKIHA